METPSSSQAVVDLEAPPAIVAAANTLAPPPPSPVRDPFRDEGYTDTDDDTANNNNNNNNNYTKALTKDVEKEQAPTVKDKKLDIGEQQTDAGSHSGFGDECIEDVIEGREAVRAHQYGRKASNAALLMSSSSSSVSIGSRQRKSKGSRITEATTEATSSVAVTPPTPIWNRATKRLASAQTFTTLLAAAAFVLALLAYLDNNNNNTGTVAVVDITDGQESMEQIASNVSLLDVVKERGHLKCGFPNQIVGFAVANEKNIQDGGSSDDDSALAWSGFDVDLCRSLSAAIFGGDSEAYEATALTSTERWVQLNDTSVDLVFHTSITMQRDVFVPELGTGAEFTRPYYYDGMAFGGLDDYVTCAEAGRFNETCAALAVCVFDDTTFEPIVESLFPDEKIVRVVSWNEVRGLFPRTCNVVASERFSLTPAALRQLDVHVSPNTYRVGTQLFSREPVAVVTRQGDPRWTDFVNFVLQALIYAEERNITQAMADKMPTTTLFGTPFEQVFVNALGAVGNYGELYNRHLEAYVPRSTGPNRLNQGDTPRQFNLPFGDLNLMGPEIEIASPTVRAIKERGFLRCGATTDDFPFSYFRDGEWRGFSNDFCRAVSAALFDGVERVLFIAHSSAERFRILHEERVDYMPVSNTWTLTRDVREPTTGAGLAYTTITIQAGEAFAGVPQFVQCADDLDVFSPQCQALRVCASGGTTYYDEAVNLLGNDFYVHNYTSIAATYNGLLNGDCNVVFATVGFVLPFVARSSFGVPADFEYVRGKREFGIDSFGTVTREDDPLWTDFIRWVIQSLFYAEINSITQDNPRMMPQTKIFGGLRVNAFAQAVGAIGNFQEQWDRDLGVISKRSETIIDQYANFTEPLLFSISGFDELEPQRTGRS